MTGSYKGVGVDIFGVCRRCGEVWHVVVAVLHGRIAKVECKQCGARHAHRGQATERHASATRPKRHSTTVRASDPLDVEANESRPMRPYSTSDHYQAGDRVLHPSFGQGVVQAVTGPKKVLVRFSSGDKTLVQARGPAQGSA